MPGGRDLGYLWGHRRNPADDHRPDGHGAGRQVTLYLSCQRRRKGAPAPPGSYMILPRRQQAILDQMERALGADDPQLRSSFAAFARRARGAPSPAAEVIPTRPVRFLVLGLIVLLALGFLAFGISDVSG